jgi:diguanylate cyclase (GGDEF)-like protein/PAS domain S-box-containing protein
VQDSGNAGGDSPGRPSGAALEKFVDQWAPAAALDSNVPLRQDEIIELFTDQATLVADAIRAEASGAAAGRAIGARLVAAKLTGASVLPTVLTELQRGLLRAADLPANDKNVERLTELCGRIAEGYVEALRETLIGEHDTAKREALMANVDAEQSRRSSDERFSAVFAGTGIGIGIGDLSGRIVEVNPAMCAIFGRTEQELLNRPVLDFVHSADAGKISSQFASLISGSKDTFTDQFRLVHTDGELLWTHVTMSLVRDEHGAPRYPIATVENVSELHLLQAELSRQALHDPMTGLANASQLHSQLEYMIGNARPGDRVALCYLDIDGFKVVNDGLGRQAGDALLKSMASVLTEVFHGRGVLVARVGGDGFGVLIDKVSGAREVISRIEEVQERIAEPIYFGDNGIALATSVGIVEQEAARTGANELIRAAEITLHRAKAAGKSQWMLYETALDEADRRRFHLGAIMPGAVETGEFRLAFAPVHVLADNEVVGYHASLRWEHPDYGRLGEGEFTSLAEETGLIVGLGRWGINQVCEQAGRWQQRFGDAMPAISMTLSRRMAADQHLVADVRNALRDNNVVASKLTFAFPAEVLTDPDGEAVDSLTVLADLGVGVGADGLGVGPALLDLTTLPMWAVRLAPVVAEHATTPSVEKSVRGFVDLAHSFGMKIAGADIGTGEQLAALRRAGVDIGCGSALSEAICADQVERELSSARR